MKTLASFLLNNNSASNTYFKELLHYFKIQQKAETLAGINENSFIDSISGTKFTITDNIKRKDFIGYNIINTAINMDKNLNFPSLDLCKNFAFIFDNKKFFNEYYFIIFKNK